MYVEIKGNFESNGVKKLTYGVDVLNELVESDENNNEVSKEVMVVSYYDLEIEDIVIIPSDLGVGQESIIRIVGKNVGNKNLFSSKGLTSYIYDFADFEVTSSSSTQPRYGNVVSRGDRFYLDFTGSFLTGGVKNLSFMIDSDDELPEFRIDDSTDFVSSNENNFYDERVEVLVDAVDYAIDLVEISPEKNIVNSDTTIRVRIKNSGDVAWADEIGLRENSYGFEDDIFRDLSYFKIESEAHDVYPTLNNPIEPGEVYEFLYTGRFNVVGEIELNFVVDYRDRVKERNEENNATTTKVFVYATEEEADFFNILDVSVDYISSSSIRVNWSTDKLTTGRVLHRYKCCWFPMEFADSVVAEDGAFAHSVVIDGIRPGVKYYYDIEMINNSVTRGVGRREFWMPIDDNVLFVEEPSVLVNSLDRSAEVSWSTNMVADARLYYRADGFSSYSTMFDMATTSEHSLLIKDLEYGSYDYYVVASSTSGTEV